MDLIHISIDRKGKDKYVNQLCHDTHSLFMHSIIKNLYCNQEVVKRNGVASCTNWILRSIICNHLGPVGSWVWHSRFLIITE